MRLWQSFDAGRNTLMAVAASQFCQTHAVGFDQANAGLLCALYELTHARIAACDLKIYFNN
jgi:hypothetical protein